MIELSWSGLRVPAIAAELDCSQKTVRCWLHRFNRSGLQGLTIWAGRAASGGSPRRSGRELSPWSKACRRGGCGGSPSGSCGPSMRPDHPSGHWILWLRQRGPKGSRWAARRSAVSCSPRGCAGAKPGPGHVRRTRTSSQKDTGHRPLHPPARRRDGDLR
ncbi:helix-turn-helix domain-containing protein [Streptomyces sp. NPDC058284]